MARYPHDADAHAGEIARGSITVIISCSRARLAKTISGSGAIRDYDQAYRFDLTEYPVSGLDDALALLRDLQRRRSCAVVRGAIADRTQARNVRRLAYADPETGEAPTLRDVPRRWLALDVDGLDRPDDAPAGDIAACGELAIDHLPDAFHAARCIVQATASHGIKPGMRLRLWYWLSRATSGAELKVWLRDAPVDSAIFNAAQPIYTAAPLFMFGASDPLVRRLIELPGPECVVVPNAETLTPPTPSPRTTPVLREGSAREQTYLRAALIDAVRRIDAAPNGGRHKEIIRQAAGLARFVHGGMLSEAAMVNLLWQAAQRAGKHDRTEFDDIIKWALARATDNPIIREADHGRQQQER